MINFLNVDLSNPGFIILWIILIFGFLCLVGFVIKKLIIDRKKEKVKIDDKQVAKDELDRLLVKVDDEKIAKEINDYKDNSDEN